MTSEDIDQLNQLCPVCGKWLIDECICGLMGSSSGVERFTLDEDAVGPNPTCPTKFCGVDVIGSIKVCHTLRTGSYPVLRSI